MIHLYRKIVQEFIFQILIPPQDNPHGTLFNVMCPGENERYHNLMIFHDGSVNRNLEYKDVCPVAELDSEPEYHHINIAYNNDQPYFEFNDESKAMTKYPLSSTQSVNNFRLSKYHNQIAYSWETLKIFFDRNNIVPNWINCYQSWGWFDDETGKWTGAVGKVKLILLSQVNLSL